MNKILILDDIKEMAERYRNILVKENYDVKISHNSTEFLKIYKDFQPDLIILDVELNGSQMNGIEFFKISFENKRIEFQSYYNFRRSITHASFCCYEIRSLYFRGKNRSLQY
ncbi:MAG TPA: response regulator [Candidatus Cloacimonetes bacterium]|nr:response regulator [Candidatus Cloacimonadota bacterium]